MLGDNYCDYGHGYDAIAIELGLLDDDDEEEEEETDGEESFEKLEGRENHINWAGEPYQEEWFQHWFNETTAEESVELGYGRPYMPTKAELEILIDRYERNPGLPNAAERVAAIREAIASPRWTREWPWWEQGQEEGELHGREEAAVNWQREGF